MEQIARNAKQIGAAVRRARRSRKLTQAGLAGKVGVRQATVSSLEAGEAGTKLSTLMDALAALGLELVVRVRESGSVQDIEDAF